MKTGGGLEPGRFTDGYVPVSTAPTAGVHSFLVSLFLGVGGVGVPKMRTKATCEGVIRSFGCVCGPRQKHPLWRRCFGHSSERLSVDGVLK